MNANRPFSLGATDFSDRASAAMTVAAKFALRRAEPLQLVHAIESRSAAIATVARRRLEREAVRLREFGTAVETRLFTGTEVSRALLKHIRTERPALVVVAAAVKGPLDRWALGSFSERIAESSPVPTLVIRDAAAFDGWDGAKGRLRILAALDLRPTSDVVLQWIKTIGGAGPSDIVPCYINHRAPLAGETVAGDRPVNPASLQRQLERDLKKKVRDQLGDAVANVVVRPNFGDPAPRIIETAQQIGAQLIAVGTHQRHGFRRLARFSVSRELLHESGMNVVCVPTTARFDPREAKIPEFRRVLVATDFSKVGDAAVPFACAACAVGGVVRIVHVARTSGRQTLAPRLRDKLSALIPGEADIRVQQAEVEVLAGRDVAATLCGEADRFGADLVCVASHGAGASRALRGSVTRAVLNRIHRPLLVIRLAGD